jgi:hypothetical protein
MTEPPKLKLARDQLARVQVAAYDPVDWSDLAMYSFYALENAVVAAADHFGVQWKPNHPSKVEAARLLANQHGLPNIANLLIELNTFARAKPMARYHPPRRGAPKTSQSRLSNTSTPSQR